MITFNLKGLAAEDKPTIKQPIRESVLLSNNTEREKLIVEGLHDVISKQIHNWIKQRVNEGDVDRALPLIVEVTRGILKENSIEPEQAVEILMGKLWSSYDE